MVILSNDMLLKVGWLTSLYGVYIGTSLRGTGVLAGFGIRRAQ
jgi:hypothetical protein